ncbi:MAG: cupredoxin domain-containing protein [Rudaea sp.]
MNKTRKFAMRWVIFAGLFALAGSLQAADMPVFNLTIKNHQFAPTRLKVPSGTQFKVIVANQDPTPEEFESNDFNREKIVMPNASITVFIGPLKAGTYKFFGDFHQETAQGTLLVE